jgi:hypothetical protein
MRVTATEGEAYSENWDFTRPGVLELATSHYAGLFCSCGDYSCRAMNNPTAARDNRSDAASSFYPDSWSRRHRRLRTAAGTRRPMKPYATPTRRLPDIEPVAGDGVMRWPTGQPWVPEPEPPAPTGLFGRITRTDRQRHALAAAKQVRALAAGVERLRNQLHPPPPA